MSSDKLEDEVTFEPEPAHLDKLDHWPNFQILSDQIDGILPTCKIDRWTRFETILADGFHDRMSGDVIYRGQRRLLRMLCHSTPDSTPARMGSNASRAAPNCLAPRSFDPVRFGSLI